MLLDAADTGDFHMTIDLAKLRAETLALLDPFYQDGIACSLAEDVSRLLDEIERLTAENERMRYVLDGVAGAIDTGRIEPLHIWRGQIDIARAALAEGDPA